MIIFFGIALYKRRYYNFREMGPSSKDFFFWPKWDPCPRIFSEKVTHFGGTSPYALRCEYPPEGLTSQTNTKNFGQNVLV